MVDITNLDEKMINSLSNLYSFAQVCFDCKPEETSRIKQKKMRKYIEKTCGDLESMTAVKTALPPDCSGAEFWNLLRECSDYVAERKDENLDAELSETEQALRCFSLDVQQVFADLLETDGIYDKIIIRNEKAYLNIGEGQANRKTLILHGVHDVPDDLGEPPFYYTELECCGEEFRFNLDYYKWNDETEETEEKVVSIKFEDAEVSNGFYRAGVSWTFESPWDLLIGMAGEICERADIPGFEPNEAEKELIPLLSEIAQLDDYNDYNLYSFPTLKAEFERYGYTELAAFAERIESGNHSIIDIFVDKLNRQKYADLWRDIYSKAAMSQKGYPSFVEEKLKGIDIMRNSVQQKMKSLGFSGTYPNYYKEGRLKGAHLETSYGKTYFVGPAKRTVSAVSFFEYVLDDQLCLVTIDGIAQLKNGEAFNDIFDCCFNADGRRIFHSSNNIFRFDEVYRTFCAVDAGCTGE
ncbi:MAG: hypothetical protein NC110_02030, partial [Ruminococcus sp.]|nr:hypothetical protein [Ruminococcus sp.]